MRAASEHACAGGTRSQRSKWARVVASILSVLIFASAMALTFSVGPCDEFHSPGERVCRAVIDPASSDSDVGTTVTSQVRHFTGCGGEVALSGIRQRRSDEMATGPA